MKVKVSQQKKRKCCSYICTCIIILLFSHVFSALVNNYWRDNIKNPSNITQVGSKNRPLDSSLSKLQLKNSCTKKIYFCSLDSKKFSYVYFLAEPSGLVVSQDVAKPEFKSLTYFHYTFASVARLAELTSLHILILVTHEVTEEQISLFQDISQQIIVKRIEPLYKTFSISTKKPRHIHTFGKYEVLLPDNTMGFSRLVFMVSVEFFFISVSESL